MATSTHNITESGGVGGGGGGAAYSILNITTLSPFPLNLSTADNDTIPTPTNPSSSSSFPLSTLTVATTTTTTTNYSGYDATKPTATLVISWIFIALFVVVFIVGLGGNCLVCFAVWRNPRMRSVTNIFLVNLAVADLLVVLICLPPTAAEDFFGFWHLGLEMCKIVKYVQKVSVFVSVLTLTAISIERWMAICQPFMFRQTAVRARRIISVVWLVALACAVPDLVGMTLHWQPDGAVCQPLWTHRAEELHLLLIFVLFYLVPLVVMTFTYVRVALCLWRSGSMGDTDEAAASVPRAQMLLRKKKAKMLIVVVLLFALCYLPVYLLFIFMVTGLLEFIPSGAVPPLAMLAHWLCYFNSSVNPVIYNFMSCNFRREFQVACFICCRRGSESRMTAYEAMRLRNVLRTQHASRASHHEISGLTRTESTMLTTRRRGRGRQATVGQQRAPPVHQLPGGRHFAQAEDVRRCCGHCGGGGGGGEGQAAAAAAAEVSSVPCVPCQQQLLTTTETRDALTAVRPVSPESTRRTRVSAHPACPGHQHRLCLYTAVLGTGPAGHRVNPRGGTGTGAGTLPRPVDPARHHPARPHAARDHKTMALLEML
ncbi:neuromedin-B receptor-like [Babylonia areolata]|uniref:neuromedin-B receptor-like n=1 Tax=Babylonia areolata TaxID=304850 RepID=UPI003FD34E94